MEVSRLGIQLCIRAWLAREAESCTAAPFREGNALAMPQAWWGEGSFPRALPGKAFVVIRGQV